MESIVKEKNNTVLKIVKGIITSFIITLLSIAIFAIFLTYSNISETIIPTVIIFITFISIFISTFLCMKNMNKNGLINGALIGGIYVILLYLISSILNTGFAVNVYSIIMIIVGVISGVIGRNNWNKH